MSLLLFVNKKCNYTEIKNTLHCNNCKLLQYMRQKIIAANGVYQLKSSIYLEVMTLLLQVFKKQQIIDIIIYIKSCTEDLNVNYTNTLTRV